MTTAALLIVIYVRISDDVKQTGLGVKRQLDDCNALIASLALVGRVVVIDDNDESAYRRRKPRPGWTKLAQMIERGEVGTLVAYNSDRLYRRMTDLEQLVSLFERHPVEIRTVTSGDIDLSTADGRMTARILASTAQHESERKAERIIRKHRELAEAGKWKGGPRPFGYEPDGVTIRQEEAVVAREAARRILAGQSATQTARWASAALGRTITQPSLTRSLTSPHIAGIRVHLPAAEREAWSARRARREVIGDEPEYLTVTHARPGIWPPVLDEETWREIRAIYRSGGRRPRPRRSLLAGVLRCAQCKSAMGWGESANQETRTGRYATYRCVVSSGGCGALSVGAYALDQWVASLIRGAAAAHADEIQALDPPVALDDPDRLRRTLMARLDELADAFGAGELTRDQHLRQRERVLARVIALDAAETDEMVRARRQAEAWSVVARWESVGQPEQAAALRALIREAWVFRTGRGRSVPPECRVAFVWIDDKRELTLDELRARLAPPPVPLTDAERKERRNARDRAKRRALNAAASG